MARIYPIALDLGAKNTGVYNLNYQAGVRIKDFSNPSLVSKTAFVAEVIEGNQGYKFIQTERTATRHALRCRKRRKQAKNLFIILLERIYDFNTQGHKEAINHFLNRRGYNYHESAVDFSTLEKLTETQLIQLQNHMLENNASSKLTSLDFNESDEQFPQLSISELNEFCDYIIDLKTPDKKSPFDVLLKIVQGVKQEKEKEHTSGAKHRKEYFAAIFDDINAMAVSKEKQFKKLYNTLKHAKGFKQGSFIKIFWQLLCHVNNFDLKLLNRINKAISVNCSINEIDAVLAKYVGHWILKLWQGSDANTDERKTFKFNLKNHLKDNPNKILDFLITTEPLHTISPYESHTNRNPPYCQTLLLNADTLTAQYQDWQTWLDLLTNQCAKTKNAIDEYSQVLSSKTSKEGNTLIDLPIQNSKKELQARQLQFIFDATAKNCPYKLSEIWGKLKQIKQLERNGKNSSTALNQLSILLESSLLPRQLKNTCHTKAKQGSFWHLVSKYFQSRRKAKQGRYFIHRDNTQNSEINAWQSKGKLLQVCQHKPKQLRHQAVQDVLVLLGLKVKDVEIHCEDNQLTLESLAQLLKNTAKGIVTLSKDARKAQKDYGINLKSAILTDEKLRKLAISAEQKTQKLAIFLFKEQNQQDYFIERNKSVFTFAQLHSLLFNVDRSGFGKTCPVCSADNGVRMQMRDNSAQASRLSTMSLRLIDGGLKRLLNHQAHHIANRLWPELKIQLEQNNQINVPLILEQNKFDFSANLHTLKGQSKSRQQSEPEDIKNFEDKKQRIIEASKQICPYNGKILNSNKTDIDHIIPRSGAYGVLNDEANLIATTLEGNRQIKQNRIYTLTDLDKDYLKIQFGTSNTKEITSQIHKQLWNENKNQFVFGQYRQFLALNPTQQTAFRHALFLRDEDEVKQAIITAIQHKQKNRVNGTQRFMAQLLADILWQKARKIQREKQLSFDYFEYSANGQDELSTTSLRRLLTQTYTDTAWDLTPYNKQKGQSQTPYSHVIDAMCAMALAIEQHKHEGSLAVDTQSSSIWPNVDEYTGEYQASNFSLIALKTEHLQNNVEVKPVSLVSKIKRRNQKNKPHQIINRRVFAENALGLQFFQLIVENNQVIKGYYHEQDDVSEFIRASQKIVDKSSDILNWLVDNNYYLKKTKTNIIFYQPNKQALLSLMFTVLNEIKLPTINKQTHEYAAVRWLFGKGDGQLFYYTNKTELLNAPGVVSKLKSNNPHMQKWLHFYQGWQAICGGKAKTNQGIFVITPENFSQWQTYCAAFLNSSQPLKKHQPIKKFTMLNETTARGNVALQNKQGYFILYSINNNEVPKAQSIYLLLNSKNLVALDKTVLAKGYVYELNEKINFKGADIKVETLFNKINAESLNFDIKSLEISVPSNTQINILGVCKKWFESQLLIKRDINKNAWLKRASLNFDKFDTEKCAIDTYKLKHLINTSFRVENNKTIKLIHQNETLTIGIPVKSEHIAKLLSQQNPEV